MPFLSLIVLILLIIIGVWPLLYLAFRKIKGKQHLPPNALWFFELIEQVFEKEEVKNNGLS
jgi:hypothetical protein